MKCEFFDECGNEASVICEGCDKVFCDSEGCNYEPLKKGEKDENGFDIVFCYSCQMEYEARGLTHCFSNDYAKQEYLEECRWKRNFRAIFDSKENPIPEFKPVHEVHTCFDENLPENWKQDENYVWIGGEKPGLKASPLGNKWKSQTLSEKLKEDGYSFNKLQFIAASCMLYEKDLRDGWEAHYHPVNGELERLYEKYGDKKFIIVCQDKVSGEVFEKVWRLFISKKGR